MYNRRQFLIASAAVSAGVTLPFAQNLFSSNTENETGQWLVSACSDNNSNYYAAAFSTDGRLISKVTLPARGHDAIAIPNKPGQAIIFARRPGMFALVVDFSTGKIIEHITTQSGRHFYGHGVFSQKNNVLLTTENDYQTGQGVIVVRDSDTYQILDKFDSGGIGPHQCKIMPSTATGREILVIANGGIQTHPDHHRKRLNLATMKPNLTYLELASGKVLDSFRLDNRHLSIRHLDVSKKGKVIAGLQYQGASTDINPLIISHQGENSLQYLLAKPELWRSFNQYTASVCIDDLNQTVAISCPRANLISFWDLNTNSYIGKKVLKDGAGLALTTEGMFASSGKGVVLKGISSYTDITEDSYFPTLRWDNHMTSIASV
ncbi:MAG: DUF1513 domain-containing protein [Colwellia sp.]|nr:DUF1513 domain-containing protein [Colwellia sp.]